MPNQDPKAFPHGGRDASKSAVDAWNRRLAELSQEGYSQRIAADEDWARELARNRRQDREAWGTPRGADGTPWLKSNREG